MRFPFHTIGHSNRALEDFVELLRIAQITAVADIRTVPKSRTNPQYNKDALPESLAAFQVAYEHIAELGGLRGKAKTVPPELNGFWENQSFHNYADYALSEHFRSGLHRLIALGRERRCAHDVLRSCLVALSPPHRGRSSDRARRKRFSSDGAGQDRAGQIDGRRTYSGIRRGYLSGRAI